MRGAPPVEIRVRRQGSWRAFVVALVILTSVSMGLWLASAEIGAAFKGVLAAVTLALGATALSMTAPFDLSLRWTGSSWALSPRGAPASEPVAGVLTVAIDLGSWMLLRFVDESPRTTWIPVQRTWIPVQRAGIEGDWHALRCAVHAPRALAARTP